MKKVKRLYTEFKPENYKLSLRPNRDKMTFTGEVIVTGNKTGKPSRRLTFHQKGLRVTHAEAVRHDRTGPTDKQIDRINNHSSYDELRLHSKELLYPGKYTITLKFHGRITEPMHGIYPCNFAHNGKPKQLIATQFESHHAREVFPCIDEPEAKANFDLTLETPAGETVISNTPIKEQKALSNEPRAKNLKSQVSSLKSLVETTFETTPKMSTYLLAFVYGELRFKESKTNSGVAVRTYATPDNVELTEFSLSVAVKCLEFFDDYFGIPYPLEKCDLIALPDFASGAMENWGCITFREQALLVDEKNTSLSTKQYVAMVVAHELAHQWFGNLVTMRWWTDLWLNEGFASWIEYLAVDHIFPEWQMWTQFISDEQQQALKLDALKHTHAIEVEINHPDEIRTIFDAISYSKGSSLLHMLHLYLGADLFREGLSFYLSQHAYNNADTDDLWAALEKISQKPVKEFMHAWTSQSGFPLLKTDITDESVSVTQERFYLNPSEHQQTSSDLWPITLQPNTTKLPETLTTKSTKLEVKVGPDTKLNTKQSGFYRTVYNATHINYLAERIRAGKLSNLDRLGLLSDQFEASKAGYASTADALRLLDSFGEEHDAAVWDVISGSLANIRAVMDDEQLRESMKPFVRHLTAKQLKRLGWTSIKSESHFDRLLRPNILGMSSLSEEPSVVKEALRQFNQMHSPEDIDADLRSNPDQQNIKKGLEVDPDLRGVIYGTAVRNGGKPEFDKLLRMYKTAALSEEKVVIAGALTGFKQPELIQEALEVIKTKAVRLQDVSYWVAYSFMNRHAKTYTWDWVKENWHWLDRHLGNDLSFYRMPFYAGRAFSNLEFLDDFRAFFEPKRSPALDRSINQAIELVELQAAWKTRDLDEIRRYFESKSSDNQ